MGRSQSEVVLRSVHRSRKRKRSSKSDELYEESYEVERIIKHEVAHGKVSKYLVKWKDFPSETNTWEPLENLRDCMETVADYFHNLVYPGMDKSHHASKIIALKASLMEFTDLEIINTSRTYFTEDGDLIPEIDEAKIEALVTALAQIPPFAQDQKSLDEVRTAYLYKELKAKRDKQLCALKQWEKDIQAVSTDSAPVRVLNSVDLAGPPINFNYINSYISGPDIIIPFEPPLGCGCSSCPNKCCSDVHNGRISYNSQGILRVSRGTPIYECNKACKCDSTCTNRVIQRGRTIPVAIFRTNNGCGWGLRTSSKIQKGQFVVEYVGEVISTLEAERRGRYYDKQGCTYLFDLDFNDKENFPYTVDAAVYGNVSHFINHSCNPNLEVFAVWVDCLDPSIPRLGLFASRSIKENEELTFDYLCQPIKDYKKLVKETNSKNSLHIVNNKKLNAALIKNNRENECKCGAHNCRKYLFFY